MRIVLVALCALAVFVLPVPSAHAGEGGQSVYLPGSRDFQSGVVPGPGTYVRNDFVWLDSKRLTRVPRYRRAQADLEVNAFVNLARATHVTNKKVAGGWYGFGALLPMSYANFEGREEATGFAFDDGEFGLGDLVITPAALGWNCGNFHWSAYTSVYAPTGKYSVGDTVNIGKNHWAWDVGGAFTWLDPKRGHEFSIAGGYLVNFENHDTDYRSGDELHFDFFLGQHLSKKWAVGAAGYWIYQTTGDSGSGAILGDFRGRAFGLGPAVQHNFTWCRKPASFFVKAYWDIETKNRLKGRSLWAGFSLAL